LVKGLIVFGVVFAHELAHVIVARRLGVQVGEVELLPFGGVARVGSELVFNPWHEFCVAIAGPACNIVLAILTIAAKNYGLWHESFSPFFLQCNLFLALFNMIPALPLDGGRVLRAYLSRFYGLKKSTYISALAGQVAAGILVAAGIAGFLMNLTGLDILVVAVFLLYAATKEKGMGPYYFIRHTVQKKKELVSKGILPANIFAAREDIKVHDAIKLFVPGKFHFIMVVDNRLGYIGMLGENDLVDAILKEGLNASLGSLLAGGG
ncbi:MAG TPA: site-2 protease family protein, partial [Clostridia bacterium]|nr:site-2 protease family protein [Clostridia bacterium]